MQIKNFEKVVEDIQIHITDYLNEQGIDTSKNFHCINPKHKDSSPSCSMIPGSNKAYCHGCGSKFDIFDCAYILEHKPANGFGFITETVQYLADKYQIPIELGDVTEDKLYELATYRAYKDAANYITTHTGSSLVTKEIERRGWSETTLKETLTGSIPGFHAFIEYMKSLGYEDQFLKDCDLHRSDIFNSDALIFTICDEYGHPVGFAARNLLYNKEDSSTGAKYINQKTTGVKTNIYQKGKRLYGFNLIRDLDGPIYIFEGQGDVLTARERGILNCCAIGSTALTTDHILLLKEFNKFNIVLCLDGDKAGQDKIEKLLDTRFAGHRDMRVSIVLIPDGEDPDDYIRNHGPEAFKELAKWSAFEWRLERFTDKSDPMLVSSAMIPFIVNEPSYLAQEDMAKILSNTTGYSVKAIQAEVARLQNSQEERKATERKSIVERALKDVLDSPNDAETLLTEAKNKLFEVSKKYDEDTMSEDAFLKEITEQRTFEEFKDDTFSGFVLSDDLKEFQDKMNGQWNKDVLCIFAGKANSGKTAFMSKLGFEIASRPENNAVVIYHTIDDTREQLLPRLVSIAEGSKTLTINQIRSPKYWTKQKPDVSHKRSIGYSTIEKLAHDGHLIVKDANHGTTIAYMETLIQYFQERYPKRQIVYILDNFHKLSDFSDQKEERIRFKKLSNTIKDIATKYHVPVLTTCEYNKSAFGTRPDNNSIAETRALEYDANLIVHLYNEMHEKGLSSNMFHIQNDQKFPIIEMIFGKNKITSFKSSLWFEFYPASSDFKELQEDAIPKPTMGLAPCKQCGSDRDVEELSNGAKNFYCTNVKCPSNKKKF